jgi:hypothetical protein
VTCLGLVVACVREGQLMRKMNYLYFSTFLDMRICESTNIVGQTIQSFAILIHNYLYLSTQLT